MAAKSTLDVVRETMADVFDADDLNVSMDSSAEDVEGWDSLSNIRLMVTLERKFGVRFSNAEIGKLTNVGDLVRLIESKIS